MKSWKEGIFSNQIPKNLNILKTVEGIGLPFSPGEFQCIKKNDPTS